MKSSFTLSTPTSANYLTDTEFSGRVLMAFCLTALVVFNIDSLLAVEVAELRAPMQGLKKEIWSYMYPIKLAAVAIGAVMSVTQQSLMPFGVGAAIGGGIQFFDTVLGDGSAALI
ncbi:MAG: hypothetical protein ACK4V2_02950 [Pseudomonadota bacterium]